MDFTSVNHELGLPVAAVAQVYTSRRPTNTPLEHRYIFSSTFDTLNVVHERKQRFMPEILAVCLKRAKYFNLNCFFRVQRQDCRWPAHKEEIEAVFQGLVAANKIFNQAQAIVYIKVK